MDSERSVWTMRDHLKRGTLRCGSADEAEVYEELPLNSINDHDVATITTELLN